MGVGLSAVVAALDPNPLGSFTSRLWISSSSGPTSSQGLCPTLRLRRSTPPKRAAQKAKATRVGRKAIRLDARVIASEAGAVLYKRRQQVIEPVFANTKHNRYITRFGSRGRSATTTEWRLITATHNLLKLHNHHLATA